MPAQSAVPGPSGSIPPDPGGGPTLPPSHGTTPTTTRRTRTGSAWVGISVGALVLVALIVFMLQNTARVEVAFLGLRGSAPLALTLLIAGIGVGLVAVIIGSMRIGQLRHRLGVEGRSRAGGGR